MKKKPTIALILGTAREERESYHAAVYLAQTIKKQFPDVTVKSIDVADFAFGITTASWEKGSPEVQKWRRSVKAASAFVIVSPEYNHSFPGELKIALDCAYVEYADKPVIIAGVSNGIFGGARGMKSLQIPLGQLGMNTLRENLYFGNIKQFAELTRAERDEQYRDRVIASVKALIAHLK